MKMIKYLALLICIGAMVLPQIPTASAFDHEWQEFLVVDYETNAVAHWDLDETTAGDAVDSVNGYDASEYVYMQGANGKIDRCAELDGNGDYFVVEDTDLVDSLDFGIDDDFAIYAWVNADAASGDIVRKYNTYGFYLTIDANGYVDFVLTTTSRSTLVSYDTSIVGEGWVHVGAVRSDETISIYIDGNIVDWTTNSGVDESCINDGDFYIGGTTNDFDGHIDDVIIYDDDVLPSAFTTNPDCHWKFDDGSGTTPDDEYDAAYDGSFCSGPPTWVGSGIIGTDCLEFDGTACLDVNNGAKINFGDGQDFSIYAWILYDGPATDSEVVVSKYDFFTQQGYFLGMTDDPYNGWVVFGMVKVDGTTYSLFSGYTDLDDDEPHHIGLVRYGSETALYVDGKIDKISGSSAGGSIVTNVQLHMGSLMDSTFHFNGRMDDVRIYRDYVVPLD